MMFPVDLTLVRDVSHMPALPALCRSMNRPDLQLHDFCIPVNSYFPTPELFEQLGQRLSEILRYYPSDNQAVSNQLATALDLDRRHVVVSNGSTELISWIYKCYVLQDIVIDVPTFGRWTDNAHELGRVVHPFFRQRSNNFQIEPDELIRFVRSRGARALSICNPNNPTGALMGRGPLLELIGQLQDLDVIIVDESFVDFASEDDIPTLVDAVSQFENLVVIKSLGKNFGLHGLRCGYAVAGSKLASDLRRSLPPWNVNSLAEEFIRMLLTFRHAYDVGRRRTIRDARELEQSLATIDGLTVYPANANFVYCELEPGVSGVELRDSLLRNSGCFVRECGSKLGSSSRFLRIASRTSAQQQVLIDSLRRILAGLRTPTPALSN